MLARDKGKNEDSVVEEVSVVWDRAEKGRKKRGKGEVLCPNV